MFPIAKWVPGYARARLPSHTLLCSEPWDIGSLPGSWYLGLHICDMRINTVPTSQGVRRLMCIKTSKQGYCKMITLGVTM
jgi:hypothetical protein